MKAVKWTGIMLAILCGAATPSMQDVARQLEAAVVYVDAVRASSTASGTAFAIGPNLFATAHHVIEGARSLSLQTRHLRVVAQVLAVDEQADLALLRAEVGDGVTALRLSRTTVVVNDELLLTAGYPGSGNDLLDRQVARHRSKGFGSRRWGHYSLQKTLVTRGPTLGGASGSPMVKSSTGEIVGVLVAGGDHGLDSVCTPVERVWALVKAAGLSVATGPVPNQAPTDPDAKPVWDVLRTGERAMLVLDLSTSMSELIAGTNESRWTYARREVTAFLQRLRPEFQLGVRFFGPTGQEECAPSELIRSPQRLGPGGVAGIARRLQELGPGGWTPLVRTLREAIQDLGPQGGAVLTVTDGVDSCGADIQAFCRELAQDRSRVKISLLALLVDKGQREVLRCIADTTGGAFVDLHTPQPGSISGMLTPKPPGSAAVAAPDGGKGLRLVLGIGLVLVGWTVLFFLCRLVALAMAFWMPWGRAGSYASFVYLAACAGWAAYFLRQVAELPIYALVVLIVVGAALVIAFAWFSGVRGAGPGRAVALDSPFEPAPPPRLR